MDEIFGMAFHRSSPRVQRLENLQDFSYCLQLITAINQRVTLIRDSQPSGTKALAYWVQARLEIERLASTEIAMRKMYQSAVRAGYAKHPYTADDFPILGDALVAIATIIDCALAICVAAEAQNGMDGMGGTL